MCSGKYLAHCYLQNGKTKKSVAPLTHVNLDNSQILHICNLKTERAGHPRCFRLDAIHSYVSSCGRLRLCVFAGAKTCALAGTCGGQCTDAQTGALENARFGQSASLPVCMSVRKLRKRLYLVIYLFLRFLKLQHKPHESDQVG